jgi:hypothetical protein
MIELRPYEKGDVHYLRDIDRKATDFPYDAEAWKILLATNFPILVLTDNETPVGFATMFPGDDADKVMWLGQLSVLPSHEPVAELLLEAAVEYAIGENCKLLKVTCCELHPDKCNWYVDHEFTHAGTIEAAYGLYGQTWAGYYFTRSLPNEDAAQRMEGRSDDNAEASDQN